MIDIKALNKKDLLKLIDDENFGAGKYIPISRHRARAQAINPRADEDDILLLIAVEKDTMLGYLGILPDLLFSNGKKQKVGWFSCLWVSPEARGKSLSSILIKQALRHWNNKILSADYVPFTKKIYDKTKAFSDQPYTKTGLRLYLRSDLYSLLPPKANFFKQIKLILKIKDAFFNTFLDLKLNLYKNNIGQYVVEEVHNLNTELKEFIVQSNPSVGFNRSLKDLDWILKNPWIIDSKQDDGLSKKYHFSSVANDFQYKPVSVKNKKGRLLAILIFAERDQQLKLPYLFHRDNIDAVADVVNHLLVEWKIKTFTCFHPLLCEALKGKSSPSIHKKTQTRSYMVSSDLESIIFDDKTFVQDGDGDCCFT